MLYCFQLLLCEVVRQLADYEARVHTRVNSIMRFVKMQGTGNDFILFDALDGIDVERLAQEAPRLCDRHFGIGSDGILVVAPSSLAEVSEGRSSSADLSAVALAKADFRMVMFNPDGSEGMCGNGLRCFAKYLYENGYTSSTGLLIQTVGGIVEANLMVEDGTVTRVRVNMGPPRLKRGQIPMLGEPEERALDVTIEAAGETLQATCLSMGNPHCVIFREDVEAAPLEACGPAIEHHSMFPQRTNVELVQMVSASELRTRVWERGVGPTLACGTGACAAAVAANLTGRAGRQVTVHMPGGDLEVDWADEGDVYLSGPAETVFVGEVDI